jgi:DNA-binding response OmpR family regulator
MSHVLIVEDDADVREMLQTLLRSHGYTTEVATNGRDALAAAEEEPPCLILLDLMMPIMSGWEFRERQLADSSIAGVPVVCLSAVYDHRMVTERLKVPCLSKPVDFDELLACVSAHCPPRTA